MRFRPNVEMNPTRHFALPRQIPSDSKEQVWPVGRRKALKQVTYLLIAHAEVAHCVEIYSRFLAMVNPLMAYTRPSRRVVYRVTFMQDDVERKVLGKTIEEVLQDAIARSLVPPHAPGTPPK